MSTEPTPNAFAPTPLGKDWTPPDAARTRRGEQSTEPVGTETPVPLDDLFEDSGAVPAAGNDSPAATGLDDLFEDAPAGIPTEDGAVEGNDGAGLDDLFGGEETVAGASAPSTKAPVAKPRVRRRGVPAALRPKNRVVSDARDDSGTETAGVAPAAMPPLPERQHRESPTKPVDTGTGSTTVSSERLQVDTPTAGKTPPQPEARRVGASPVDAPRRRSLFEYGAEEISRAWTIVDQTLAIVGSDISLQQITSSITLTADEDAYAAQRTELHAALRRKMASAGIAPSGLVDSETILDLVVDEMSGISVLGELFRDPSVDEILVDRWDIVSVERRGHLERTRIRFRDHQHAESCARVLALKISDRAVSRAIPLVTAELPSARITFAFGAVVKGGLSITIRKFRPLLGLEDLLNYGSLNRDMVEFLRRAVTARAGILVSGGTGTGKTTIVNLLSSFIPDTERVVSIEDAFELKLANTHVVSLQTKEASSLDDTVSVTLAELLRSTLRMRPDRIIVGEIREGAGAMVMLSAASTGHDGTLTTVHANSAEAAVNERLPDLVRQSRGGLETETILRSVTNAFDLVIHVSRTRDGRRYLSQVSALDGIEDGRIRLQPVFTGSETPNGIRFERHVLGADTELARRLAERRADGMEA